MKKYDLKIPRGYNPRTQAKIGYVAGQLDDQFKLLKKDVAGLTIKQLEWQLKPGMNTIGILLAHLAVAELWWLGIACKEMPWNPTGNKLMKTTCGFEDDGIPLKRNGKHNPELKGYSLDKYLKVLIKVRRRSHKELKTWSDRDLDRFYTTPKGTKISYGWTLYHVLEHFSGHYGQIQLLKHLMRDKGILT